MDTITDQELQDALKLNRNLARRASVTHADDLESIGYEIIVKKAAGWNDEKRALGSFCAYLTAPLRSYHRRAMVNFLSGVRVPCQIADSNERLGDFVRTDLDALEPYQNPLSTALAPDSDYYGELHDAFDCLPDDQKLLVRRLVLNGEPRHTVARQLGVSVTVISKRLNRALLSVKQKVTEPLPAEYSKPSKVSLGRIIKDPKVPKPPKFKKIRMRNARTKEATARREARFAELVALLQDRPLKVRQIVEKGFQISNIYKLAKKGRLRLHKGLVSAVSL